MGRCDDSGGRRECGWHCRIGCVRYHRNDTVTVGASPVLLNGV